MSKQSVSSKGVQTGKAFIMSFVCLIILLALIGLLIRFTSLPERWASLYVLAALCISCFFAGILTGSVMQKKGVLLGALFAAIFLLIVLILSVLVTGAVSEAGFFQLRYLPCILFGSIGGMIGVNLRTG